jgi:hypothetical protein
MAAGTGSGGTSPRLRQKDITAGMTLMQTVYTVALVLGLETVVDASYTVVFPPTPGSSVRSPGYLGIVLISILLLAIRFFWVPRNLNSYIVRFYGELRDRAFTRLTTLHFPITLAHALVFYYICKVFVDMTQVHISIESAEMTDYVTRFSLLYAGLLLLNGLWLWRITPRAASSNDPGRIWSHNNLAFVCLTLTAVAACKFLGVANSTFVVVVCAMFIANSLIDLWKASKFYILYER